MKIIDKIYNLINSNFTPDFTFQGTKILLPNGSIGYITWVFNLIDYYYLASIYIDYEYYTQAIVRKTNKGFLYLNSALINIFNNIFKDIKEV